MRVFRATVPPDYAKVSLEGEGWGEGEKPGLTPKPVPSNPAARKGPGETRLSQELLQPHHPLLVAAAHPGRHDAD